MEVRAVLSQIIKYLYDWIGIRSQRLWDEKVVELWGVNSENRPDTACSCCHASRARVSSRTAVYTRLNLQFRPERELTELTELNVN